MKRYLAWQFQKKIVYFHSKGEKLPPIAYYICIESHLLFNGDFFMNLHSVDSDEAMKQGDEALNTSSLLFLRTIKRFIASSLQFYTQH
jgi:hypothetical protein